MIPLQLSCETPIWEMFRDVATSGASPLDPFFCSYTQTGLGLTGVGLLIVGGVYLSMRQWSESELLPAVWLVLMGGVVFSWLPGVVSGPIAGIITVAVTILFVGIMVYLKRAG